MNKKKIKVLRIINRFNLGGPTYNAAYLTKYLEPEFETLLIGGVKYEEEESSEFILEKLGITSVVIPEMQRSISFKNDKKAYQKIIKIIKEFQPDIVHTHASKAGAIGRLAASKCKVPVIVHTFHDFIAPKETGKHDYIGAFAVTTGVGLEKIVNKFEQEHDDYNSILAKALADRLAEAFAELLHEKVRKEYWGYSLDENLTNEEKIKEEYPGIRPAPGYPAQPDHTEKPIIFDLLNVTENTGITLTESLAMYPAASVCGLYFSHPESKYFNIGKLRKDQIMDYHRRKGMSIFEVEKWLGSNLGY